MARDDSAAHIMRLKYSKLCTFIIIIVNLVLVYCTWKLFIDDSIRTRWPLSSSLAVASDGQSASLVARNRDRLATANRHIKKALTIVFRDVFHFDNDLKESIDSLLNVIPNVQILVVYDDEPYPPLSFVDNYTVTRPNVRFINLGFDIWKSAQAMSPLVHIKTKYVLFMPDSVRVGGRSILQKMLREIEANVGAGEATKLDGGSDGGDDDDDETTASRKIVAVPFASNVKTIGNCCSLQLDFPNWTIEYSVQNGTTNCDMVSGRRVCEIAILFMRWPFIQPLACHAFVNYVNGWTEH